MNTTSPGELKAPNTVAFAEAFRKYRTAVVFKVIKKTQAQLVDAEDAVQEAALGAWRVLSGGRGERSIDAPWTYLVRSAVNAERERGKSSKRERRSIDVLEILERRYRLRESEEADLWARRRAWLPGAIRRLPEGEKQVVVLRLENHHDAEIGLRLGISRFSVPVIHSRAVTHLRTLASGEGLMVLAA